MIELQQKSIEICDGIKGDLDMELFKIGISITNFTMARSHILRKLQE